MQQQGQQNTCKSRSLDKLYKQNERLQLLFQPLKHLLESWLAEGFRFPRCFVKVEWRSPTTEQPWQPRATRTDTEKGMQGTHSKKCWHWSSIERKCSGEKTMFSTIPVFWRFECKPEIFHPRKNNLIITFMNNRSCCGVLKSSWKFWACEV